MDGPMSPGRRVIAAIGVDRYDHPYWSTLNNAVNDARGVVAMLEQLGFELATPPLYDAAATYKAIWSLSTDGELTTLDEADSLIVFYAGHGTTRTQKVGRKQIKTGYLLPADADNTYGSWIELEAWLSNISKLPPRHVLVIIDACESGVALSPLIKWRNIRPLKRSPLAALMERDSRRIITSALDDQHAMDGGPLHGHSLFTGCLLEALRFGVGEVDRREITGSELGQHLRNRVISYPGSRQTPDFGAFDLDERGELVMPILEPGTKSPPSPPDPPMPGWLRALIAAGAATAAAAIAVAIYALWPGDDTTRRSIDAAIVAVPIDAVPRLPIDAEPPDLAMVVAGQNPYLPSHGIQIQKFQVTCDSYLVRHARLRDVEYVAATPKLSPASACATKSLGGATFEQASAFCAAIGARLPTAPEWDAAMTQYPWKESLVLPKEWSATTKAGSTYAKVVGAEIEWRPTAADDAVAPERDTAIDPQIGFRCAR